MNKVKIKLSDLKPINSESLTRLKTLAERDDGTVDTSDIEVLSNEAWVNAERGKFYRPVKTQTSVRIDMDVIDWLKGQGKGYQTRMNAILREAMMRDLKGR